MGIIAVVLSFVLGAVVGFVLCASIVADLAEKAPDRLRTILKLDR